LALSVGRQRDTVAEDLLSDVFFEDLLSDVFFDVWRQAGRFEGRSAVTTWLLSIARFKALSARRRRTDVELDETIETTVADCADNSEVALEKKSTRARCCAAP
jgi:RNA polymerase sigma-70 factor, ECF subfamily